MVAAFSHVGICVSDLTRSLRFYCEGLGFEAGESHVVGAEFGRLMELEGVVLRSQFIRRPEITVELLHFESPTPSGDALRRPMNALGVTHLSLRVDDVDATAAALEELGGVVVHETRTSFDASRTSLDFVYCTDPDGVRIELMRVPRPEGAAPWYDAPDDHRAIERLLYRYAELLDAGDLPGVAKLFEHAVIGADGAEHGARGEAAVAELMAGMVRLYDDGTPGTKHVTTNVQIEVADDRATATARSYFTVLQAVPGFALAPVVAGRYRDRFARHHGEWCFVERRFATDLVGDLSHHLRAGPGVPGGAY